MPNEMDFDWTGIWCHFPRGAGSALALSTSPVPIQIHRLIDSLAIAELYITLATISRRFEMENYETTVDDVKIVRDFFVGVPKLDSLGVRAVVTGVLS